MSFNEILLGYGDNGLIAANAYQSKDWKTLAKSRYQREDMSDALPDGKGPISRYMRMREFNGVVEAIFTSEKISLVETLANSHE